MHFSTFLRNKYSILILGIATVIYLVNISNKESIVVKPQTPSVVSNQQNNLVTVKTNASKTSGHVEVNKTIQNELVDKNNAIKNSETQVPWEELHQKWLEELKTFLVSINEKDGSKMFKAYIESREKYLKEDNRLGKKYQKLSSFKPLTLKQEDQLAVESSENFRRANERNKKNFGQHYDAVKKFYREFEDSIQVYSRDMPISLDLSFED